MTVPSAGAFFSLIATNLLFITRLAGTHSNSGGSAKGGVPQVVLVDEKGEHRGVQGSYCWGEICVDYVKPSSRTDIPEKLPIQKDVTITFKVEGHVNPKKFQVSLFEGEKIVLDRAIEAETKLQVPRGTYFLNVKATWEGEGDVSNVFLVDVL